MRWSGIEPGKVQPGRYVNMIRVVGATIMEMGYVHESCTVTKLGANFGNPGI